MLHLRWITDIHNTPETIFNKRAGAGFIDAREARREIHENLERFVKESHGIRPTMVINTGDDIDTTLDAAQDEVLLREFQDMWSPIAGNSVRVPGNHDVARFSRGELAERFGFAAHTESYVHDEATIIVWNASTLQLKQDGRTYFTPTEEDMIDLANVLDHVTPRKPILLFSHVPFRSTSYEEPLDDVERNNPQKAHYSNPDDIFKLIEERHLKVLAFAGHRHYKNILTHNDRVTLHGMDRFVRGYDKPPLRPKGVNYSDIIVDNTGLVDVHFHGPLASTLRY